MHFFTTVVPFSSVPAKHDRSQSRSTTRKWRRRQNLALSISQEQKIVDSTRFYIFFVILVIVYINQVLFSNIKQCPLENFCCIYLWSHGAPHHIQLALCDLSEHTVIDWNNHLRGICSRWLLDHQLQLGGPGRVVQIGKTVIKKQFTIILL
jgi:hypothetical protein